MGASSSHIGGWLSEAESEKFHGLAVSVGLDESALAIILIVRELSTRSLAIDQSRFISTTVTKEKRITSRPKRDELKVQFQGYCNSLGLSMDATAAFMVNT